jgi:hypothetical protein
MPSERAQQYLAKLLNRLPETMPTSHREALADWFRAGYRFCRIETAAARTRVASKPTRGERSGKGSRNGTQ